MKKLLLVLVVFIVISVAWSETLNYTSLSFATNMSLNSAIGVTGPSGNVVFGSIPFSLGASSQVWHAESASGSPRILDIAVGVYGVKELHTIINTWWGVAGGPYASIQFFGSAGATYTKYLYGNVDIRDYNPNNGAWTETINNTTTTNVWTGGGKRLDKQYIVLPEVFATQNLVSIRITDSGATSMQRIFLAGATVGAVPEPSSFLLFGLVALFFFGKKKPV